MKLSHARAIYQQSQKTPLIQIFGERGNEFGRTANVYFDGDHCGFGLQGNADGTEWWVAHYVYGGSYAEGATKKEAALAFANKRLPWLKERAKSRKLAAKIVEKYGIGPVVAQEGTTWVARLDGKVVGKAANYSAAMKIGLRAEKQGKENV